MKSTLALFAVVLSSIIASTAQNEIKSPKDFMAFKLGDEKSCEVQINWKRDINDNVTDYSVYNKEGRLLKAEIPFDPTLQPITVVDPTGAGQRGIYVVPGDGDFTYVPIQINYCGDKKGIKYTTFYVKGVNKVDQVETRYHDFSISTAPFQFVPSGSPSVNDTVTPVKGKKRTFMATWTYDASPTDSVKGFWVIYGEKNGTRLGNVYVAGADSTNATFTLTNDMSVENVVLAVSALDIKQAISSPTNSREASIIPDRS